MTTNTSHGLGMNIFTLEYKYITCCFKQSCYSYQLTCFLLFWAGDTEWNNIC